MNHEHVHNKQAASTVATSAISVLLSIIASSHHWLHMAILFVLGGSTNMMVTMSGIVWLRRAMLIMTLITSIYAIYRLTSHKRMPLWMKVMNVLSTLIALGLVVYTLIQFGW